MYRDLCLQRFHLLLLSAYLTKEVYLKAAVSGGKVSVKVHFRFSSPSFENTANVREVTSPSFQHANWYLQTSKLSKLFYLSLSTSTLPVSLLSSRSKHQQDSSAALKERKASLWPVLSERSLIKEVKNLTWALTESFCCPLFLSKVKSFSWLCWRPPAVKKWVSLRLFACRGLSDRLGFILRRLEMAWCESVPLTLIPVHVIWSSDLHMSLKFNHDY